MDNAHIRYAYIQVFISSYPDLWPCTIFLETQPYQVPLGTLVMYLYGCHLQQPYQVVIMTVFAQVTYVMLHLATVEYN